MTGCSTASPKESPCIGLLVQDKEKVAQKSVPSPSSVDAIPEDDSGPFGKPPETADEIEDPDRTAGGPVKVLSKTDQLELLEIAGELNAVRKRIFILLDSINSMDMSRFGKTELEIIDEIEDALAESRHYLDHEAELIFTLPYVKNAYFVDMVKNRMDGILKTREIIHLYKTNLEGLYKKIGKGAAVFSPNNTLKQFQLSLEQLDLAKEILQPYVNQESVVGSQ